MTNETEVVCACCGKKTPVAEAASLTCPKVTPVCPECVPLLTGEGVEVVQVEWAR